MEAVTVDSFVKAAKVSDLKPGDMTLFESGDERVLLVNVGGQIHAVGEVCPHQECYLSEDGALEGAEVECVCHGSRFNATSGEVIEGPSEEGLGRYAVRIEGDDILVGPA